MSTTQVFLLFNYFVGEDTTIDNLSLNIIEYNGEHFPETIPTEVVEWVKTLFREGTIELGVVRERGDEGNEYYVEIKEFERHWEIFYTIEDTDEGFQFGFRNKNLNHVII